MKKISLITLFFFILPAISIAYTEVINNISTSVFTGDNSAKSGEIIEGETKASVKIHTEINKEVIEDFQKETINGEEIDYEAEKKFNNGKVETKVRVNVQNQDLEIATSSLIGNMSKVPFNTLQKFIKYVKYVFSFFKF